MRTRRARLKMIMEMIAIATVNRVPVSTERRRLRRRLLPPALPAAASASRAASFALAAAWPCLQRQQLTARCKRD